MLAHTNLRYFFRSFVLYKLHDQLRVRLTVVFRLRLPWARGTPKVHPRPINTRRPGKIYDINIIEGQILVPFPRENELDISMTNTDIDQDDSKLTINQHYEYYLPNKHGQHESKKWVLHF